MNKLLIIDDEEHIRTLYKEYFGREGFEIAVATDTGSARNLIESFAPDLIILDVELDEDNGLNFLKYLKSSFAHIPVILNSAYAIYKTDFHSWAADAYIVKSSDLEPLKAKVKELIDVSTGYTRKPVTE
jgi:DNA-binding response OmpR family regulator